MAFLALWWALWIHMGANKEIRLRKTHSIGDEDTVYGCMSVSEGGNSFCRFLDLTLTPNKTNEGVQKQWNTQ